MSKEDEETEIAEVEGLELGENDQSITTTSIETKISRKAASETYVEQWKNRRLMAWFSLITMIGLSIYVTIWLPETRIGPINPILTGFMWACASVVGAYMGFSTWASINRK